MTQQDPWDIPPPPRGGPQRLIPQEHSPQTADERLSIHLRNVEAQQRIDEYNQTHGPGVAPPGNTSLTGAAYLATIPPADAHMVEAMRQGHITLPTQGRIGADPNWQRQLAEALQAYPDLDQNTIRNRQQAQHAFLVGPQAQNITSYNTALGHLQSMEAAIDNLHNFHNLPVGNYTANAVRNYVTGSSPGRTRALADFEARRTAVGGEAAAAFRRAGVAEADIQNWMNQLDANQPPEALHATVQAMIDLLGSKIAAQRDSYRVAMGAPDASLPLLSPEAAHVLATHGHEDLAGGANAAIGAPPTVGGPPPGSAGPGGAGPIVGGPQEHLDAPNRALPSPSSGFAPVTSDTPPAQEVTPEYIRMASEFQSAFDNGATAAEMQSLAQRCGMAPFDQAALDAATRYRDSGGRRARILPPETMTPAGTRAAQNNEVMGREGAGSLLMHGATLGLTDEASGVGGALYNVLKSPFTGNFDPVGAYQTDRDAERIRLGEARDSAGWGGTAAEIAGGLASVNPTQAAEAVAPTLWARMRAGASAGGRIGAVSGFGNGNGVGGSLLGAVEGAAGGAAVGGTLPIVASGGQAVGRGARGLYRLASGNNPELAPRTVARLLVDDANTPANAAAQIDEAHANGVPAMLADTGDNARGTMAALARAPGSARTMTREALRQRQEGLPDRITAAIERDLGPISNPHQVAEDLMAQARTAAAPLYLDAYSRPGADTFARDMGNLLRRPSIQGAMQRAQRIAAEEGRDPNTAGFDVNSSGEVSVNRTPSWQTLDYVKRGLDDVLNAQPRNPATGQIIMDEGTRAIDQTRRAFLTAFDEANPAYGEARSAYSGPVQGRDAMQQGMKSLRLTADDLSARINRMTPFEQDMFRLGHRRAMADQIANGGDQSDMVNALIGNGRKREALSRLYGENESFPRFISTLQAEQAAHQTFRQALTGSPTAPNIQDDAALPGAAATAMADFATTGGLPIATGIREALQLGGSRVGRNAQEQISALLSENNPARVGEFARALQENAAAREAALGTLRRRPAAYGVLGGGSIGSSIQDLYGP
jgi:hypothetical protein